MASSIMLGMVALFQQVHWPDALWVLPLSLLGGFLFSAMGLVTTAIVKQIDHFNLSTFLIIFPMFLFSATFFPIDILPGWALKVAWALPLTHLSSLLRAACLGATPEHLAGSVSYLLVMTVVLTGAAVLLMKRRLVK
jgi:lipooligosaccharide transport system permease protein